MSQLFDALRRGGRPRLQSEPSPGHLRHSDALLTTMGLAPSRRNRSSRRVAWLVVAVMIVGALGWFALG